MILITAVIGVYYAKYEGSIHLGLVLTVKPERNTGLWGNIRCCYCVCGFIINYSSSLTDIFGFLLIFPITRKLIFNLFAKNSKDEKTVKKNIIDGEFEDIEDDNDRKI